MTYNPQHITNQSDLAVARFITQFQDKPYFEALLRSYMDQLQKVEDMLWEVITYRSIKNGFGITLDKIGKIVGRPRQGLIDSDYKIALYAQILINKSTGTPPELIKIAQLSIPIGFSFSYSESYPAGIIVRVFGQVAFNILVLFSNLRRAKSGGVRLQMVYSDQPTSSIFQFAPASTVVTNINHGFGDIDRGSGRTGGQLSNVLDSGTITS